MIELSEHPIIRHEEIEQIRKERIFKTNLLRDIERDYKESSQILNNYFGGY